MKILFISFFLFSGPLWSQQSCHLLYQKKIKEHQSSINRLRRNGKGKSQKAIYHTLQRKSLIRVHQLMMEVNRKSMEGIRTKELSKRVRINPRTVQNILRRADRRGYICENDNLMDFDEIAVAFKNGRLR